MDYHKPTKKVQFLRLLPYGLCSKQAAIISSKKDINSTKVLMGNKAEALITLCNQYHNKLARRNHRACANGVIKEKEYTCGTPAETHQFYTLTQKGLHSLLECTPTAIVAESGDEYECNSMDCDGNIKDITPEKLPRKTELLREILQEYSEATDPSEQAAFNDVLLEAVQDGLVTPLTSGLAYAGDVKISNKKYSQNQIYNIWRISTINAMFMANDLLTYLDRRPYDTHFAIDGITDDDSYQVYLQKHGMTMAAFCYRALNDWYSHNPHYYYFTQQDPDDSQEGRQEWLSTPAFYNIMELPGLSEKERGTVQNSPIGSQQKMNYTAVGLATGRDLNYVCYYGKSGPVSWVLPRETKTQGAMEKAVREMKTHNPEAPIKEEVKYALYFCSSHHQFLALFARTKEKHKKKQNTDHIMQKPYAGVYVIPDNDSGAFLLWCLMEESAFKMRYSICNNLVRSDIGFTHTSDNEFPLIYKNKRVFFGHTMDVRAINKALIEYLNGNDFYIICLTEQVKWYKALFPGITIL